MQLWLQKGICVYRGVYRRPTSLASQQKAIIFIKLGTGLQWETRHSKQTTCLCMCIGVISYGLMLQWSVLPRCWDLVQFQTRVCQISYYSTDFSSEAPTCECKTSTWQIWAWDTTSHWAIGDKYYLVCFCCWIPINPAHLVFPLLTSTRNNPYERHFSSGSGVD